MKTLKNIWKFLNSKIFGFLIIGILLFLLAQQCKQKGDLKRESLISEQNISALNDSITIEKQKGGEMQASINAFIATEKQLKDLNSTLYNEVKKQKGNVVTLNKMVFKLKQDKETLEKYIDSSKYANLVPIKINDSTYVVPWMLAYTYDSTNYDIFKGNTKIGVYKIYGETEIVHEGTFMDFRESQIDLVWGQKEEDGKLRVFAQTNYPGFSPESLEGVLIDPNTNPLMKDLYKKRHWFSGFGIGPTLNVGYDFLNQKPAIAVGVGIHYSIFQW